MQLFAPFLHPAFVQKALGDWRIASSDPQRVAPGDADLVLVLHQSLSRLLPFQDLAALSPDRRPFVAYLHLSPHDPFEAPGVYAQPLLADAVFANSEETRHRLRDFGLHDVGLFQNPAPARFAMEAPPPEHLTRLLSVSSHPPPEVEAALDLLSKQGVEVYRIGKDRNFRRTTPADIQGHDAVLTIGKTVQYGLRGGRPVYCYDHFRGPGWINRLADETEAANFSGRCSPAQRSAEAIAEEILAGYADARAWALATAAAVPERFKLETCLDALLDRAESVASLPRPALPETTTLQGRLRAEAEVCRLVDRSYASETGVPWLAVSPALHAQIDAAPVETHNLRAPEPGCACVFAAFSYRHDAHLVPDLLKNIGPSIHGYVAWDDRAASEAEAFTDETIRQTALFHAARKAGADWLFAVDPDERFEDELAAKIGPMTNEFGPVVWTFACREMFSATDYRIDGIWGNRRRARLFPCVAGMEPDRQQFHGRWTRNALKLPHHHSALAFYHLRMASAARRRHRHRLYAALDAKRKSQALGYDYLDDERGLALRRVEPDRGFSPPFIDDGGLWAAKTDCGHPPALAKDPPKAVLKRLQDTARKGGYATAASLAQDYLGTRPDDQDMALWGASAALAAEDHATAVRLAKPVAKADRESLWARLILAEAYGARGKMLRARSALRQARGLAEGSLFADQIERQWRGKHGRLDAGDALWRRWIDGTAILHDGARNAAAPIATVVLSMGAPRELRDAVASLLDGALVPEIVVVNSCGGDVMGRLGPYLDRVRIISTEGHLYPGAARNVGIDASHARFVSFLASDCTVGPENIAKRLDLHQKGARAVSGFVVPQDPASLTQTVASLLLHPNRHVDTQISQNTGYSLSLDRGIFRDFGYFPTAVRIGEDTALRRSIEAHVEIESDAQIFIRHAYPNDRAHLAEDIRARAERRVLSASFPAITGTQDLRQIVETSHADRLNLSMREFRLRRATLPQQRLSEIEAMLKDMLALERAAMLVAGRTRIEARRHHDAGLLAMASKDETARTAFAEAMTLLPEDASVRLSFAKFLDGQGATGSKERLALLEQATTLNPGDAKALMLTVDAWLAAQEETKAQQRFELSCLMRPDQKAIWARHAPLPGDAHRPMRVMALQKMFCLDPFDAGTSRTLSENYAHAGNAPARGARLAFLETVLG